MSRGIDLHNHIDVKFIEIIFYKKRIRSIQVSTANQKYAHKEDYTKNGMIIRDLPMERFN